MKPLSEYRYDVEGFSEDVLGIRMHPGQVSFAQEVVRRHPRRRWRAMWLTICLSAGNRAGKTAALAIVIIHSVIFKLGIEEPDIEDAEGVMRWLKRPYMWFHFAIQQEIAELVFTDIVAIFSGLHLGQPHGCPLADQFATESQKPADWEKKYNGDYRWIVFSPSLGGGEIHFRTTAERALGSLGRDMHGISFDECGFEPKLQYIVDNVLHLRRLGTGGQLLLVSTPEEGLTEFADLWFLGDPEQPDRKAGRLSLRMSTRDNLGYGLTQWEFDALTADMDEDHIKQNIDGYFIQGRTAYFNANSVDAAFVEGLPEVEAAKHEHLYVQGVDPAIRVDSMWSVVFDVHEGVKRFDEQTKGWTRDTVATGVRVERSRGRKTTDGIVELAETVHYAYDNNRFGLKSTCTTAIDSTGFGGHMFQEQLDQKIMGGVRSIEFGGTTQKKRKLLGDLRTMLDTGRLKMPRSGVWLIVRRQLLGYKIDDKNIEQDAVMALACAVAVIKTQRPGAEASSPFDALAVGGPKVIPKFNPRKRLHFG